jgi:L-aminopeptidase/D-esterase-like protein
LPRARDVPGLELPGEPGAQNAITDVDGVHVGHTTLVSGDGPLRVGTGPVPTGVTVIVWASRPPWRSALFAGCHRLNGNGDRSRATRRAGLTPLYDAVADATEEAVLNALLAAVTMTGGDGITAHRLEPTLLAEALEQAR